MNKRVHRLVFDRNRGMYVPAAEHVRGAGKQSGGESRAVAAVIASLMAAMQPGLADAAQPIRPTVGTAANAYVNRTGNVPGAAGNLPQRSVARWAENHGAPVTLTYGDTTLTVGQEDRRVILNWESFNIGQGYSVHFQQPVGGSALNKIWDANPTVILGKLTSTGEVILENTSGVFFGSTARVEAGRFVATALSLSKETYLKGIRAESDASVAVFGSNADTAKGVISIEAGAEVKALAGGDIMMIAPKVVNDGAITTTGGGQSILAAGQKVYLYSSSDPAQRGLLVSVDAFAEPVAAPDAVDPVVPLPAGTNGVENNGSIRAEKGAINLVGMTVRQNGALTATTAIKGQNGAIYLQASKTTNTAQAAKAAELGEVELTANSKTKVEIDTSGATQVDAETFYRSNIEILGKDVRIRSGALVEAKGGNIDVLATRSQQPAGGASALNDSGSSLVKDDATLVVESGAVIDASGVKDVQLDMSRNQMSGRLFKIELADAPVQRDGVLYRQTIQFDGRNAVTTGNTKGFYNAVKRTAQELSTKGGNVRLESTGNTVLADGATVDISGGSLKYQAGTISTSLVRRGDQLIALNKASADVKYDELLSSSQTLAVDGYEQGADAGSLSVAGGNRTYAGLSGVKAGVVVGPYQRNGQFASTGGYEAEPNDPKRSSRSRSLYQGQSTVLKNQPNLYASLRPQSGTITIGQYHEEDLTKDTREQFLSQIDVVGQRTSNVIVVPEVHTDDADAFFASLPAITQVSALEVQNAGAGQLTVQADQVHVARDVKLDLGASGSFTANATQDVHVEGAIAAAGGTVNLRSYTADVHLDAGASLDVSGMEVDERSQSAKPGAVAINGGNVSIRAGQSLVMDDESAIDVSAGILRTGKGAITKGNAGKIALKVNQTVAVVDVPVSDGVTRKVYDRHGELTLKGTLSGFDFNAGGTLELGGMRSLVIGDGAVAADHGLELDTAFFSANGFGTFTLSALGDVSVQENAQLQANIKNWVYNAPTRNATSDRLVSQQVREKGLRKGINLTLTAESRPTDIADLATIATIGLYDGASVSIGSNAVVDVGAGGSIALEAGRSIDVDGTLRAQGGNINLRLLGDRGSAVDKESASSSTDSVGYVEEQVIHLKAHAWLDASGVAKLYKDAGGRQTGEVLGGGAVSLNYSTGSAVRGFLLTDAESVIDVSGQSADINIGRGANLERISKGAGTINIGSTEGFLLQGELKADRPDASVAGGTLNVNVSRAGLGDVIKSGTPYTATERAIVLTATQEEATALGSGHLGQGILSADRVNAAGFDRVQLRADDRVVLGAGANLDGISVKDGVTTHKRLRSAVINSRVLEAQGTGEAGRHVVSAQYVALGNKDLPVQFGESSTAPVVPASSKGAATLNVQAGLIEVYGTSALRGIGQTELNATLAADGTPSRRDGEVRWIGRSLTTGSGDSLNRDLNGAFNFSGDLDVTAGQTYATTLSDFVVQGALGDSSFKLHAPTNGSTSQTPLTALASLKLQAQNLNIDGVIRQPFGQVTINGELTPELGAHSVLSVSGDGVKVPVGTTVNQTQWLYMADGSTLSIDPTSPAAMTLDGKVLTKGILVTGKGLKIDGRSQMQAQAGGDLIAWEFIPGVGGSSDTLNRGNVFAIVPNYSYDFAPYDTEINGATAKAGTQLTAGDRVTIGSTNGILPPGQYTLLPARYAVLPGAVLVSETAVKSGADLAQGIKRDDGSVTVSGYKTAVGTAINGGQDPRLALVLEPESTFRAKSEIQVTSINQYQKDAGLEQEVLPGDAGRISLVANEDPFQWAAQYNLAGKDGYAAGQLDLAMKNITVVSNSAEDSVPKNGVTVEALQATGAGSVLLGGYRTGSTTQQVVTQVADTVLVSADVELGELLLTGQQSVTVDAGVTMSSTAPVSTKSNGITVAGNGAAVVVSNKINTSVKRDLSGADRVTDAAKLVVQNGATFKGAVVQLDSSANMALADTLNVHAKALGLGAKHVAVGGLVKDEQAVVVPETLLNNKERIALRAYDALDLAGNTKLNQAGLKEVVLDAPIIRGVGASGDVAEIVADHVVLRNTSQTFPARDADQGTSKLLIKGQPPVADATAEGVTLGEGQVQLAFNQVNVDTTGDVVMRGKGRVTTQGDATIAAARLTADKTADHGLVSAKTLTVTHTANERTLGDRVGAGGKVLLEAQRVVQDGLIDVASGRIDIHGTGQTKQTNSVELTNRSETRAAGWVAKAGQDWSTVAPGGQITVRADQGNVLVNGVLDVSAPEVTLSSGQKLGANAGNIVLQATGQASDAHESGAVVWGRDAQVKGRAVSADKSGRISVDARRMVDAQVAGGTVNQGALDRLAQLAQAGDFHNEVAARVREGDLALNTAIEAARVKISADVGKLALGTNASIDARAERGGLVQLAAGKDLIVGRGAQILADSSISTEVGANGGDILLASTQGWVDLQAGATVSARGDDAADGRVVIRAKVDTTVTDETADADAKRIQVRKIGSEIKAADLIVEGVQTYATADGENQQTQALSNTSVGAITKVDVTKVVEGGKTYIVTTTSKGRGVQVETVNNTFDPVTGQLISSVKAFAGAPVFDKGVKPVVTVKKVALVGPAPALGTNTSFDKPASNIVTTVQTGGALAQVGGHDILAEAAALTKHQAGIKTALGMDELGVANAQVRAGVEVRAQSGFTLAADWNLQDNAHLDGQPISLTIRSQGDLNINGSLSDGFASANRADASAKKPVEILSGPAASYRLVAGADFDAADVMATQSIPEAGSLTVAANKIVRTTSGSIEMAAAGDVVMAAGTGDTPVQGVVYVAGSLSANPEGANTADRSDWQQFTSHGGRLEVAAGRDVISPAAAQLINNWFYQTGSSAGAVAWASSFDKFKQGYGSFGGGNLTLTAARDIVNPGVAAPTTARTVTHDGDVTTYEQVVENGGDVVVRAGRDIRGGVYLLGRGLGNIQAGGAVTQGDALGYVDKSGKAASLPKTGLILGLMDGQWGIESTGDLSISAVYNPTMIGLAFVKADLKRGGVSAFDTYSNDSAVNASSVAGNLNWSVDGSNDFGSDFAAWHKVLSAAQDAMTPVNKSDEADRSELMFLPTVIRAQAMQGDVNIDVATSGNPARPVVQHGSDQTNLTIYAGQNTSLKSNSLSAWVVNAESSRDWSGWTLSKPAKSSAIKSTLVGAALIQSQIDANKALDMGGAAHQDPVRIHAGSDLAFDGLTLNVVKTSQISAEGDIKGLSYIGQHQSSTDVTSIVAGVNLTGSLNSNKSRDKGVVQVSGPGELQLEAGRDLNLQNAYGVETVGLPKADGSYGVGASLRVSAGAAKSVDHDAFASQYLNNAVNQAALTGYVESALKISGLSYDQAWAYFKTLTREHQVAFAQPLVSAAFVQRYVQPTVSSDSVWAYVARDQKASVDDKASDLYSQYTKAQAALVAYVQDVTKQSGLTFDQSYKAFRGLTASEQAGLVDKKKAVSVSMLSAMMAAGNGVDAYAKLWDQRVAQAKSDNPNIDTGYDSVLFGQFRDDVVMTELQRIGSVVTSVADSDNPVMNERRKLVRDDLWRQARELTEVAGLAAPYQFEGNLNLASSKIQTQGHGDLGQGGIDLFVPGGGVQVGRASASEFDRSTDEAPRRGLIAQDGGSIRSYSAGDFQVNSQKAFVVGSGDLMVYSSNGNIDSGRGSNTDLAVPPLTAQTDPFTGGKQFVSKAPTSGSGIGILKNADGSSEGKVSLLAPNGEVRALDAFIQGPQIELPGKVVGADNVKGDVKGQAPAPVVSVNLSINSGLGAETAAGETKDQLESKKAQAKTRSSLVTVDLLGLGEEPGAGSSDASDEKQKDCKKEDCKR